MKHYFMPLRFFVLLQNSTKNNSRYLCVLQAHSDMPDDARGLSCSDRRRPLHQLHYNVEWTHRQLYGVTVDIGRLIGH
jgi:hypothetical protein